MREVNMASTRRWIEDAEAQRFLELALQKRSGFEAPIVVTCEPLGAIRRRSFCLAFRRLLAARETPGHADGGDDVL
jgi:hypothetical protein